MATHIVDVEWTKDLTFEAHQQGRSIKLMASPHDDSEHRAISPKMLLLTGLAGCTAIDVASLLPKLRVGFTSLRVVVEGELSDEHPKTYINTHIIYEVGCDQQYLEQVERAVELSVSKYCGVYAMLSKASEITHQIRLVA